MKFLTDHKQIKVDLNEFSLNDLIIKLQEENYFTRPNPFYIIEKINDNHLIIGIPRERVIPKRIYDFHYDKEKRELSINGRYANYFFHSLFFYCFPAFLIYKKWADQTLVNWKTIIMFLAVITVFNGIIIFLGRKGDSEFITRDLFIRLNYLLKQKGIKGKL